MPSSYSQYKIELQNTGENSGTWGTITNANFGSATPGVYQGFEQAIGGRADVTMSSTTVTLTLTDTNAAQDARALYLNLSGTPGGAADLVVPALQKAYLVKNGTNAVVTIKVTGQTGVPIPVGSTVWVYNNGTDVVDAVTHLSSLTLGSALPIASGGTGSTSTTFVNLATNVTGTLPVSNGGTGQTTYTNGQLLIGNTTGNTLTKATLTAGTGISITNGTGSISIEATNNGTVTSVATGTGLTGGPITSTGTVSVATNGITDTLLRDSAALSVIGRSANSAGDPADIAAGTDHQVLRRSGSTLEFGAVNLASTNAVTGTLPVSNGGTGITSFGTGVATALGQNVTGSGGIALATSPSFTTPTLGVATATSVNKVTITAPATAATLTIADNKTLTASNSITLAGTDGTTMTFPSTSQTVAGLGLAQTFTVSQRGTVTADNDGSFDLDVTNNFSCTPTGNFTLTFTNRSAGQSGFILLDNSGAHTISAHADTLVTATALATISAAGVYLLSYFATSSKVYVVNSSALA